MAPCRNGQQGPTPHTAALRQERMTNIPQPQGSVATPGESLQSIQPFHHESTSPRPTAIEQVCYGLLYIAGIILLSRTRSLHDVATIQHIKLLVG